MVVFVFSFDAMAYFGMLPLMKAFLGQDIGIRPAFASTWVSLFAGAVSLVMLFIGKPTEGKLGIRRSLILSLVLALVGRAAYSLAPFAGGAPLVAVALAVIALAEGINQPVCYAGVKRYTSAETSSMGFAVLYTGLNFGAMVQRSSAATRRQRSSLVLMAEQRRREPPTPIRVSSSSSSPFCRCERCSLTSGSRCPSTSSARTPTRSPIGWSGSSSPSTRSSSSSRFPRSPRSRRSTTC
jgi:hypothetical protein